MAGGLGYGARASGPAAAAPAGAPSAPAATAPSATARAPARATASARAAAVCAAARRGAPQVRIGNASATGDLDKNIIRRYIRRKLPRIRYCYEKELLVKPSLSGTVVTQFLITPRRRGPGRQRGRHGRQGRRELRGRRHPLDPVPEAEGRRFRERELPVHLPAFRRLSRTFAA